jgi:hypothetical protein
MYWNRSAADIAAIWQAEIESKLETGATAVLLGGAPDTVTSSAATLLALQNSAIQRNDIATPLLVAGGNSAIWLGLLLPPQTTGSGLSAPPPTLVYGGADEATYLAVVELTSALAAQQFAASSEPKVTMPTEMGVQFAPRLQPGAATAWEMLPFVEVGEQPTPALAMAISRTSVSATSTMPSTSADPTGDWIAWGIMLLVLCLVLSAFLI